MTPRALLHTWQTTSTPEVFLADLDQRPSWPAELAVFLALRLPPLATPDPPPLLDALAARIEHTLTRRFGPELAQQLWQAVTLFDLPKHTFVNQGYNHYFLMPRSSVEAHAQAARSLAPTLTNALRLDPALLDTFAEVADAVWSQYRLDAASVLFEILLASLPTSTSRPLRFDAADCHFILATIARHSRPHEAEVQLRRFLKLAPRRIPDNDWPLYPSYFPRMRHAPSSVAAWAECGRLNLLAGDRVRARDCFLKAIRLAPASQQAPYRELGELHEAEGRIEAALHDYRTSLEVRTRAFVRASEWRWEERPYRRELARLCLHMAPHVAPDEATLLLRRALHLDPDDASRWLTPLAQIFADIPDLTRQRTIVTRALEVAADIPMDGTTVHAVKVDMRFRALFLDIAASFLDSPNAHIRSLAWYQRVHALDGDSPELLLRQIECLDTHTHDLPQLLDLCERFLAMKPDDPDVRQRHARASAQSSRPPLTTPGDAARLVLVLTPRSIPAAAAALKRLHRDTWLDTPFIFYDRPEARIATIIVEDLDEFPPAVMADAGQIAQVLRERVVRYAPPLPRWAFYPHITRDGLEAVLVKLGYRLLVPDLTHVNDDA